MLVNNGVVWVDGLDDRGSEKREALDGDVVEKEDECCGECDGTEDSPEDFWFVDLIKDFGGCYSLGLYAGDGEVFFLLGEPAGCGWTVGQGDICDEREYTSYNSFNSKNLFAQQLSIVNSENIKKLRALELS